jgi:predicted DNA-binding protein with PD1-like motif
MKLLAVKPGEEVIQTLQRRAAEEGLSNGAIVSLIGAVDSCAISNMRDLDATSDIATEYQQPFELSGTGEITDGRVHIHACLGPERDVALVGHLHWARVERFFVHAYVVPLSAST